MAAGIRYVRTPVAKFQSNVHRRIYIYQILDEGDMWLWTRSSPTWTAKCVGCTFFLLIFRYQLKKSLSLLKSSAFGDCCLKIKKNGFKFCEKTMHVYIPWKIKSKCTYNTFQNNVFNEFYRQTVSFKKIRLQNSWTCLLRSPILIIIYTWTF